jgi:RNA polymerase sigma factor (sigma-70 family)
LSGFGLGWVHYFEMSRLESTIWLQEYAETGSDQAFGKLVACYCDLVYSAALRRLGQDSQLAQDVAQQVFTDLARKAKSLPRDVFLAGWLYQHTCFMSSHAVRSERRRQTRERQALEMNAQNDSTDAAWRELAPILEGAMSHLNAKDRNAVVLRFFEHRPFHAVGHILGMTEDGARKRVERALDKLRAFFGRRGISVSAALLAETLNTQAVTAAPADMAAALSVTSLASTASAPSLNLLLIKLMAVTKSQIAIGGVMLGLAGLIVFQAHTWARLRDENRNLSGQLRQTDTRRLADTQPPASAVKLEGDQGQLRELMQLRAAAGRLRDQMAVATREAKLASLARQKGPADTLAAQIELQQRQVAKLNDSKLLALAFKMYADQNQGQSPTNLDQVASFLPDAFKKQTNVTIDDFAVVYRGSLNALTNPGDIIIIGEKEAVQNPIDGGNWQKTYVFADGHSELHGTPDGNFGPWESQHLPPP